MTRTSVEVSVAALWLPDDRLLFQRRGPKQPTSNGLLGLFGGHAELMDKGDPLATMRREVEEETSLRADQLGLEYAGRVGEGEVPERPNNTCYVFTGRSPVGLEAIEVYEGERAEAYSVAEVLTRTDLSPTARYIMHNVLAIG